MTQENKKTLLLVEDEAIIAMASQMELEKYGYNVIQASSGEKAVSIVKADANIELILMDIDLGAGIDGTETAEQILKEHQIPVVFLSSHMEPEIVEKTEKITSYGYVVKSSSITVLDASIKMAFKLFEANMIIEKSDKKQKTMLSNITDVIGIMGADGKMKYKSPNIEKWFGWDPEELIGTSGFQNVHPDDLEEAQNIFESIIDSDSVTRTFELRYKCKDGSYKPVELTAKNLINDPLVNGILLNYRDITQRIQDENKVREKDIEYRKLLANVPDLIFQFTRRPDGSYCVPFASNAIERVFGCSPADVVTDFEPISRVIHPEDLDRILQDIEYSAANLSRFSCEFRVKMQGKPDQWIYCISAPERLSDGSVTWYGFNTNITELKKTEEALRENEEYLKVTLQSIGDAVITTDTIGKITNMNHIAENLTGWDISDVIGKPFTTVFRIIDSETGEPVVSPVGSVLRTGQSIDLSNHTVLISKNNQEYHIADSASPIKDADEQILGVILVFRDVTEEYRIRKELQKSERQYRLLFESAIEGICLHEIVYNDSNQAVDYRILDTNPSFEEILKLKKSEVAGKLATEVYDTNEAPYLEVYARVAQTGVAERFEVYNAAMEKSFHISVFSPEKGKFATIFEDITERRKIENALNETVTDLKDSQRIAHVGSWRLNLATNEVTWTDELYKMYGFDPSKPPPPYNEHKKIFALDSWENLSKALAKTAATGEPYELELETKTQDGRNGWMWVHGEAEFNSEGEIASLHGAAQDITNRKLADQEIKLQLAEKELILKESYHRIKNNFSSISNLLSRQAQSANNPEVKSDLEVAIGRVNGMKVLYEKLLMIGNQKSLSAKEYIESLVDEIVELNSSAIELKIEKDIDDIQVDPSHLFPIGLIVNELMTNILKYAFSGKDSGGIEISMKAMKDEITLTIQDDGKGLPGGFDIDKSEGFGLHLIQMLSKQLGGIFTIGNHSGVRSVLKIPARLDNQ